MVCHRKIWRNCSRLPPSGYDDAIVVPEIEAANFEISMGSNSCPEDKQFSRNDKEDPQRLRLFLKNQKIKDGEGNVSRLLDPKPFVKKRLVKNFSTSTPRTASASVLKSTPKVCNVPNSSYLRKNSMTAYPAARKAAA
ncbi:hypothetical protein Tco_0955365 [Tanacetum coccineum]|uniref:Uncharacterized protein n=1 Tax=Tanacetum coccineum TaxID=301880 RepID=A0ABQ5E6Z6_9ASTR